MAASISFDRAADYYDRTRGYPPGVAERVGQALLTAADATPSTRILELGVGTGRIALPIIKAGYTFTGIDLSARMLERLRAAVRDLPGADQRTTLIEGDITDLPFPDASFDAVISVHVLHLVSDRARAIGESVRVLARPGTLLNGRDSVVGAGARPEVLEVGKAWHDLLRDLGWPVPQDRGLQAAQTTVDEWRRLGAEVDQIIGAEWEKPLSPAAEIEAVEQRLWAYTWDIPDATYGEAVRRLRAWAEQRYGADLQTPSPVRWQFVIDRARFR
ncbi:MAG TPA: methyltransferase domain-containing protein [Chloroflexota bacterium]|nr:methyltransferase domain-containing protein [Chloroflexota bacterium]